jgi:hypothetical protein
VEDRLAWVEDKVGLSIGDEVDLLLLVEERRVLVANENEGETCEDERGDGLVKVCARGFTVVTLDREEWRGCQRREGASLGLKATRKFGKDGYYSRLLSEAGVASYLGLGFRFFFIFMGRVCEYPFFLFP